jgi:hypothetical protein
LEWVLLSVLDRSMAIHRVGGANPTACLLESDVEREGVV